MLGDVVELQPLGNAPGLGIWKGLVKRGQAMGVQIVESQSNYRNIGIGVIHQSPHPVGKVLHGAPLCYRHMAPAPGDSQARNRLHVPARWYS